MKVEETLVLLLLVNIANVRCLDLSNQYESDEDESEVEDSFESEENNEYTDLDDASFSE